MSLDSIQNNTINGTLTTVVPSVSSALLPGWPDCPSTHVPFPPGPYAKVKDWIATGFQPIIIVVGVLGNLLTVVVLSRSSRKFSSTTLYLVTLAISDTLFLLNGPIRQWIRHTWKYDIRSSHEIVCKFTVCLTYGTYQFSSWLLVALTVERVFSVLWPHKVRRSCTATTSKVVISLLFICILGLNSHWFYGLGNSQLKYYAVKTCMPLFEEYSYFFHHIWHWINFVVAFIIPFVVLAVGNSIIIYKIKRSQRKRRKMSMTKSRGNTENKEKERKTITIVLILLSTVFFLSQTPMSIYFIYIPYGIAKANLIACENYQEYTRQAEIIWLCYTIVNVLGYMNATLNFFLYIASGSRFRAEIKALLRCQSARAIGVFETTQSVRDGSRRRIVCDVNQQKISSISKY